MLTGLAHSRHIRAPERSGVCTETARLRFALQIAYKYDPGGFRTHDLRIKSPLLYQLSYRVENIESSHGQTT
jgi:hypothetical protein